MEIILNYNPSTKAVKLQPGDIIFISRVLLTANYKVNSVCVSRWNSSAQLYQL